MNQMKNRLQEMRDLWEKREPVARVAFFGVNGCEEDAVYDHVITGGDMLSMAVDRRGHLARVLVPWEHVVFFVDLSPRPSPRVDVRVYMDGGASLDVELSTMSRILIGAWAVLAVYQGHGVRAMISQHMIQEIVPLRDFGDDVEPLVLADMFNSKIWPEFGHKK
jgi:hypothetical protein